MILEQLRKEYHKNIFEHILSLDTKGIPNNADKYSETSVILAKGIVAEIGFETYNLKRSGQTLGKSFELFTSDYLEKAFSHLNHLRSGEFEFFIGKSIEIVGLPLKFIHHFMNFRKFQKKISFFTKKSLLALDFPRYSRIFLTFQHVFR